MSADFRDLLNKYDNLIKNSQLAECRQNLIELKNSEIPQNLLADFAKISLRLNLHQKAYSLLKSIMELEKDNIRPSSDLEKLQFAMALKGLGAYSYAFRIYEKIDPSKTSEVLLYRAITHFSQWQYELAEKDLVEYLEIKNLTDQQKLIGLVNHCSALIFLEKYEEALLVHAQSTKLAEQLQHKLLLVNLLELKAQLLVHQEKYQEAKNILLEAEKKIDDDQSIYSIFIKKWKAVADLKDSKNSQISLKKLDEVREKAIEMKHWETVRDCDFFFATLKGDSFLHKRLYFGTPFDSYRNRLNKRMKSEIKASDVFIWTGAYRYDPDKISAYNTIDLTGTEIKIGQQVFDQFNQNIQVLKSLCLDFYAPQKPVTIYLRISPDENIDPEQAIQRIFNAVSKLNALFVEEGVPLNIQSTDEGYRLHFLNLFCIKIPVHLQIRNRRDYFIEEIKTKFNHSAFSSSEASEALSIPKRTCVRLLKELKDEGLLSALGTGSKVKYKIVS